MSHRHVVVIGGGIVGLSVTYSLLQKGASVTLIERDGFASSVSTGNAGFVVLGYPPLPRPGLPGQALRMLLDPANPLYVPPRFNPALFRWLWHFRRACTQAHFSHAMNVLGAFGWIAAEAFDNIVKDASLDCAYHRRGWMEVFDTEKRLREGREDAEILERLGYRVSELTGDALRHREPAFRDNVLQAIRYEDSGSADPGRCVAQLAQHVAQRGASVHTGVAVQRMIIDAGQARGVELTDGRVIEADNVVLTAGIWSQP